MSEHISVALVDDQQLVRAGLAMVISSQPDMSVVGEASDGAGAFRLVDAGGVDVILMDVQMPGINGIDATARITDGDNPPKVLMLTTFDTDEYILSAINAGASGFLLKDAQPEDLLTAVRTVHAGDAVIAPRATKRLLEHLGRSASAATPTPQPSPLADPLTPREREVLLAIALGKNNSEIADEFFLSEATVKTHVGRVLAKTASRDRVQAVLYAFRSGLVGFDQLLTDG